MKLSVPLFKQSKKFTCGPAVVKMILKYYDIESSEIDLMNAMNTNKSSGTAVQALMRCLTDHGVQVRALGNMRFTTVKASLDQGKPIISIYWSKPDEHYGVIVGYKGDKIMINDPWDGVVVTPYAEFAKRWQHKRLNIKRLGLIVGADDRG